GAVGPPPAAGSVKLQCRDGASLVMCMHMLTLFVGKPATKPMWLWVEGQPKNRGAALGRSILLSRIFPVVFDLFWLLIVEMGECVARSILRPKKFIKLCMDRLGVTVLGPLDEERHAPSCERRCAMPVQRFGLEHEPAYRVRK